MAFGLVSLLVVVAILLVVFAKTEAPTIKTGEKAQDAARQISGHGEDGGDAMSSFQTQGKIRNGNLDALTVTSVRPGGALSDYGLQARDEILQVGDTKIGLLSNNDPELAKAMVAQEGFSKNKPIIVRRNGKELSLPADKNVATSAPPAAAAPPANNPPGQNAVQDQLKNLGIQTH
jgi:hypothetical protein